MKQTSIQTIAKRFFLGNLLAAALFLSANAATVTTANVASDKVEVKYTGVDKYNQLSFNVKYSNPAGNTFNLTVLDENGESIFKGFYGDKQFDKTFKLPKSEVSKLTFLIEDGKESLKQRFEVNIKTQVIEDVVVSKS
jgi:formylmethanofuran dehydrogenase subunit E-like metal-binding protein